MFTKTSKIDDRNISKNVGQQCCLIWNVFDSRQLGLAIDWFIVNKM